VYDALSGSGRPLETPVAAFMGKAMGSDFSAVRIHDGGSADRSAREIGAEAYTLGRHIAFAAGRYHPETPGGLSLLAHELAHVRQEGGVLPPKPWRLGGAHDPQEREADHAAHQFLSGGSGKTATEDPARPVRRSLAGVLLGALAGIAVGVGLGLLLGPVGAIVGGLVLGALGAWIGNAISEKDRKASGNDYQKLTDLLTTHWERMDFAVTDAEASEALGILEKMPGLRLLETVQRMRQDGLWKKLGENVAEKDQDRFVSLQQRIDPNLGVLAPGDRLQLLPFDPNGSRRPPTLPPDATAQQALDLQETWEKNAAEEFEVTLVGIRHPMLKSPVPVVGLLPAEALDALVAAFEASGQNPWDHLKLWVSERGSWYAPRNGMIRGRMVLEKAMTIAPEVAATAKRQRFLQFYLTRQWDRGTTISGDPGTKKTEDQIEIEKMLLEAKMDHEVRAGQLYMERLQQDLAEFDTPEDMWRWAMDEAGKHPAKPTGLQKFQRAADFLKRNARDKEASEKAATSGTEPSKTSDPKLDVTGSAFARELYLRFLEWYPAQSKETLDKTDPEQVVRRLSAKIVQEWVEDVRKGIDAKIAKDMEAQKEKEHEERLNSPELGQNLDKVVAIIVKYISTPPEPSIAEDKDAGVGYLIWPSQLEIKVRQILAGRILHDYLAVLQANDLRSPDPMVFVHDWVRDHPAEIKALLLVESYPTVEKYDIPPEDIPAWQTAIEIGVSFIPIVGEVVGGLEVLSGQDMFGHKLSTVDRGVMAIAICLPMVAKIAKLGKAAIVVEDLARTYRMTEQEANAAFRVYAGLKPGSAGAKIIEEAEADIRAGKSITDANRVKEIEGVAKDIGFTDRATADALGKPADNLANAGKRAEEGAAREIENLKVNADTVPILRENPELRGALTDNPLAASVFKKCSSPCFPKELTKPQVEEMEAYLEKVSKSGEYDKDLLRNYLYKNRGSTENLQKAIDAIKNYDEADRLNYILDYFDRGGTIKRLPSREEVAKQIEMAYQLGETKGKAMAQTLGYQVPSERTFVNPFLYKGKYGQGFDDILVKGGNLDTGIIAITEYKGGRAGLGKGQMTLDWVLGNIEKLEREGGEPGRFWAGKLRKAMQEGRLEGMLYSTPRGVTTKAESLGTYLVPKK
jgi:hypothetical protein